MMFLGVGTGGIDRSTHSMSSERSGNEERLSLLVDHPQWLVIAGTAMLVLGLTGLALFSPSDAESTEDRFSERPDSSDKETQ
jgi:hypothetical protein